MQFRSRGDVRLGATPMLIVAALFLTVMIGLRYEVGGDWINYESIYADLVYADFVNVVRESDPGYALLNWACAKLGFGVWLVNLVCALIFTWGLVKFVSREPNPWLAVVVAVPYLIIVVAMGYTRQGVAIGLILAGLANFERISLVKFSAYIFAAAVFHKSAIIILPLVALSADRNRTRTAIMLAVTAVVLYYLLVQDQIDRMLTNYVEAGYSSQGAAIRVGMNLPPAVLFLLLRKRFVMTEQQRLLWRNFSLAAALALFLLLTTASSTAVDRMALYIIPLQMVVLARLPGVLAQTPVSRTLILILVLAYSAVIQFVWLNYAVNASGWVPYQNYLWLAQ
jgi:hypothetical protein